MSEACEKISVIVPVYNVEKYLEDSVRSIMNQTYRNLEIICVNDGSTDGSLAILERLAAEDERIRIVNQKNTGSGGARNEGLKYADSEWISFIDSDDMLQSDAYEKVSRAFSLNVDMVHFGIGIVAEDGGIVSPGDEKYYSIRYKGFTKITGKHILDSDFSASNKVFRKSILNKYGIHFEHNFYEDFIFAMQYLSVCDNVYYIPQKLYKYLRRGGSKMNETFRKTPRAIDHIYAYGLVYDFMKKNGILESHRECMVQLFPAYYWASINHGTPEIVPAVEEYASKLYEKSPMLQEEYSRILVFSPKKVEKREKTSTKLLEKIFSIKNEKMDGEVYKVVRLMSMAVYKKPR